MTFTEQTPAQDGYYWAKWKDLEPFSPNFGKIIIVELDGGKVWYIGWDVSALPSDLLWGERIECK